MLLDPDLPFEHPAWARVIRDLAEQYRAQRPIEQDAAARFPGRPLRRRSPVRHRTCLFVGCRRPAADCQQDHRHDYGHGGRTSEHNLGPACAHDHDLKTRWGWRLVKRSDTVYVWISPLGRKHVATVDPVAPPLPKPVPRQQGTPPEVGDFDQDAGPSFALPPPPRLERPMRQAPLPTDPDPPPY
jgi:hypothetical protein